MRPLAVSLIILSLLIITSCHSKPIHPPGQWQYDPAALAIPRQTLRFDRPGAAKYIISGVTEGDTASPLRWINARADLRFWLKREREARIRVLYSVPLATFRETGPVTITISVNGDTISQSRCTEPRDYSQQATIPAITAAKADPATITITTTPPYIAAQDDVPLGVLLKEVTIEN